MSRLDELRSGANQEVDIDMTAGIDGIDHSREHAQEVVSMGNAKPQPRRQSAPLKQKTVSANDVARQIAPKKEEVLEMDERNFIGENSISNPEALANGILNGENSVFSKWKTAKIEEFQERMAQFDDEREDLIDEGKLDPKDIKDPEYRAQMEDLEDEEDEATEGEDDNYRSENNAELVLDDDDLFSEETQEIVEGAIVTKEEAVKIVAEKAYEESQKHTFNMADNEKVEEDKSVHLTEEDIEVLDNVGGDVDSSRFIQEDDEEETTIKKDETTDVVEDEDEEEDEKSSDDSDEDTEETLKHLKELITEKLNPTFKKIDISSFKVVTKKPTSNIRHLTDSQQLRVVKWVLPNQKQCVFMKQFTGLELQTLSENIQEGSITSMNIAYRTIYEHIVSNKPKKFTDWLAITPDSDIDHYMFCVFIASYKGSNFLPMTCTNTSCKDRTFLTDDLAIMDMVKFKDDEAKNNFMKIYKSEVVYSNKSGYYVTATTPVSNQIAISFKESTLKDVIDIEGLDARFRRQYATTIGIIPYIDAMYEIDVNTQSLIPIEFKEYENNPIKTLRTKIRKYAKLFDTLTSDEFGAVSAIIQDISARSDVLSYIIPATECPACGTKIEETETSATQLVFTRYQLGALVNTQIN